uniref:hybrid sensor histidine kinase/response regulator n=1 Tax=Andreprevotia chitinilytica TaxID=396808 RepID=UPI00068C7107|nr:hybrid sensor histidine kinase/response regulator [Andreprevotia chitinilytica]
MLLSFTTACALTVTHNDDGASTAEELTLWRDATRALPVDAADTLQAQGHFKRPTGLLRSRGYSRDAWWFHFKLDNPDETSLDSFVEYTDGLIGTVTLYTRPAGTNRPWQAQTFKSTQREDQRPLATIRPVFEVRVPAQGRLDVLMRVVFNDEVDMAGPIYSDVRVWGDHPFQRANSHEMFLLGGMIGVMLLVAFAAVAGFVATRDTTFLYYGLNLVMLVISFHTATGVWPLLLWHGHYSLMLLYVCSGIYFICAAQFVRSYLRTQTITPRLDWGLKGIVAIGAISSVTALLGFEQFAFNALNLGGVGFLLYIVASLFAVRAGVAGAKLFTLGWAVYAVSLTVTWGLRDYGLIEHDTFSYRFIFVGMLIEIVLFSVAMALRVAELRRQKEAAETAYRTQLERQAIDLEALVAQRTQELDQARRDAEAASRAKTNFLAHVSHEIRTPLTAILGYVDRLLQEHALNPLHAQWLARIGDSGEYLLSLISNVLDASKLETGHAKLEESPLSTEVLVRQLDGLFAEQARRHGVRFEIATDTHDWFWLDAGKWRQILVNLLGNAVKLTEVGSVQLRLWADIDATGTHWLNATVADTGPGISSADAERIFAPFEQAQAGRRAGGAGLGLAICRDFANLMGGTITVSSDLGNGATFTVRVPVTPCEPGDITVPLMEPARLDGRTILVAEDQAINRDLLGDLLTGAGARVRMSEDGAEALSLWRSDPAIDTVLADFHMPLLTGVQLAKSLRALGFTGRILLISAGHSPGAAELAEAGIDGWLGKPFDRTRLLATVAGPTASTDAEPEAICLDLTAAAAALGYTLERMLPLAEKGLMRIEQLLDAFATEPAPTVRSRHAHSAKGIAGQIGARQLAAALGTLEHTPQNTAALSVARQELQDVHTALVEAVSVMRAGDRV